MRCPAPAFLVGACLVSVLLTGCVGLKGAIQSVLDSPIAQDTKAFGEAVADRDWKGVHDSALRLQDAYVVIAGAQTIEQEYGAECASALSMFFVDGHIRTIRIVRDSPLIALVEKVGALRRIDAMTLGPRVIHVAKGSSLPLVHEVAHALQWQTTQHTFLLQYLPLIILGGGEGYEASVFEQDAKMVAREFRDEHGVICELVDT